MKRKILLSFITMLLTLNILTGCAQGLSEESSYSIKNTTSTSTTSTSKKSDSTSSYENIFEKDSVIDIKIEINEDDYKNILENPTKEEYKTATVTVDGNKVENVGIRTKGNLTLKSVANSSSDRYSYRIKFDKYVDDQTLLGLDELVVNNMYSDPSYLREYLSYETMKSIGLNVPDMAFANIYINGELKGFYLCVEALDDSYLNENFGDNNGNLYKAESGSNLEYIEGSNYDSLELKNGDDEEKTGLKNMIKTLNEVTSDNTTELEKVLDVDSAIKYIASNTVLGNYDSYNGNLVQNYYLYEKDGKFTVLPWDFNMSFGGFGGGNLTEISIDTPYTSGGGMGKGTSNLPLITKLLSIPKYKEQYTKYINDLVSALGNFENRVKEVSDIIRPYVEKDPSKFYTMEDFENSIIYTDVTISSMNNMGGAGKDINSNKQNNNNGNTSSTDTIASATSGEPPEGGMAPQNGNPPEGAKINGPNFNNIDKTKLDEIMNKVRSGETLIDEDKNTLTSMGLTEDMINNFKNMPQGMGEGQGGPGNMGPGGGGMNNTPSIIKYVRDRIENLKKQLT